MIGLNEKLHQLAAEKKEAEKINAYLNKLDDKIIEAHFKIKSLDYIAEKEALDVQKLEDNTLRSMFIKILGQNDEALEFEKQEMLLAYINLDKAKESLDILNYEKTLLTKKLLKLEYEPEEFKKLIRIKERRLQNNPKLKHGIVSLDLKLDRILTIPKEIEEAKEAINALNKSFTTLHNQISSIENWNQKNTSIYDPRDIPNYKKKKYIKSNIALLSKIEILTEKVNQELSDLKRNHELDIIQRLDIINNFFEVFFDNLLTDWIVKKGLKSAKKTIEICLDKITRMLITLDHEQIAVEATLKELKEERNNLIISLS